MCGGKPKLVTVVPISGVKRRLSYRVPGWMGSKVQVGSLVRIPIRKKSELGVVEELAKTKDVSEDRLRNLLEVIYECPVLTPDLLELAKWMERYYGSSLEAILEAMIPAAVRRGMRPKRRSYLRVGKILDHKEIEELRRRASRQAVLYEFLKKQDRKYPRGEVLRLLKVPGSSCRALLDKGVLVEFEEDIKRVAYDDDLGLIEEAHVGAVELNEEQRAASEDLIKSLKKDEFRVHLLHGVTGSGKTEVYIRVLQEALKDGGGVVYLVPEVALTPQTLARLRGRLEELSGYRTAVWHSHLSEGERRDAWDSLVSGEARVVVGARSAVFAPISSLRLIIVDEEHEPAYKQADSSRYHGRDVAVYRAKICRALCVLGSATPALESIYNTQIGKYRLNKLRHRVDDQKLPLVHVVDMKRELINKKRNVLFSRLLVEKMQERYEKKEQTILFLNRRGYSRSLLCPTCGYFGECDHCSVTLTYHRVDETLRCHVCGLFKSAATTCSACGSDSIRVQGHGTQRVEELARKIIPRARIVRIDADTMKKKNNFRRILADFRIGKIDVLVGTQMIAKGLDFPNVTLVGLVDADISLQVPDFRSAERCHQLIVQVAGRAGRGDRSGEVVVQTFLPHSEPIQYARRGDNDEFAKEELFRRQEYRYPPFRHLIQHQFRGRNEDKIAFYAEQWARHARSSFGKGIEIRGPAPCSRLKVKDFYRYQIWYFAKSASKFVPALIEQRAKFAMDKDVIDVIDVDPVELV